jgi:hypothetical protein
MRFEVLTARTNSGMTNIWDETTIIKRTDVTDVLCDDVDWIHLAHD